MEDLLTDLERKLTGHAGEDLRQTLREQIASADVRLRELIATGMAPEAFAQAQACVLALTTANDLLATLVVPADASAHPLLSPLLKPARQLAVQPAAQPSSQH